MYLCCHTFIFCIFVAFIDKNGVTRIVNIFIEKFSYGHRDHKCGIWQSWADYSDGPL